MPEGSPATLNRVLVPVDFSEPAADAIKVATSMARRSGHTEVLALHVYFNEARVTYEEYEQVLAGQERFADACRTDPRILAGYLTGSHAAGTADAHSDVDLCVVAADGKRDAVWADRELLVRRLGDPLQVEDFDGRKRAIGDAFATTTEPGGASISADSARIASRASASPTVSCLGRDTNSVVIKPPAVSSA